MPPDILREPWSGFLRSLDKSLSGETTLHVFGGFIVAEYYGLARATADIDVLQIRGSISARHLVTISGKSSPMAKQHGVYLDFVTIATVPEDYEVRLQEVYAGEFRHLHLLALEPHDLALAKLVRNQDHDREDVKALAVMPGLDVALLRHRYAAEMRWQLGNPAREDLTLDLWIEMIQEVRKDR